MAISCRLLSNPRGEHGEHEHLLRTHAAALHEVARVLQKNEVIDGQMVARIVAEPA